MPILPHRRVDETHPHLGVCCWCGAETGWYSDEIASHYNWYPIDFSRKPKVNIFCSECWRHAFHSKFAKGCLKKGVGKVQPSDNQVNSSTTIDPATAQSIESQIDWEAMDQRINNGTCRMNTLSKELNIPANKLRQMFSLHYGDRIEFKRGRNGGVRWTS